MSIYLTKRLIEKTNCPLEVDKVFLWDADLKGFGVSITSRLGKDGTLIQNRNYVCQWRIPGKNPTRKKIGEANSTNSPTKMREIAADIMRRAKLGEEFRSTKLKQQQEEKQLMENVTAGHVMEAYIEWMFRTGKDSAKAVRSQLTNHFKVTFPSLWNKSARAFDRKDARKIIDARKERSLYEANKLRSYMRTAFTLAITSIDSRRDAREFIHLNLDQAMTNPITMEPEKLKLSKKRKISPAQSQLELQLYWQILEGDELRHDISQFLKFHLLLGGQRGKQLMRLKNEDIYLVGSKPYIRLDRRKGRERPMDSDHICPLTNLTVELMQEIMLGPRRELPAPKEGWTYPFTLKGQNYMDGSQFSRLFREHIEKKMITARSGHSLLAGLEPFKLNSIRKASVSFWRRTVPFHIEAWCNDHNRPGNVVSDFYDENDFFEEKLEAMKLWEDFILGNLK